MYKKHTNTLLFTGRCQVSHGMIIVSKGSMFFLTCCLRKTFLLRLNIEKTLCSQSHMPANHLTTTAAYWKSMATKKIFGTRFFSYQGKIMFTISQNVYSTCFSPELTIQGLVFAVGNKQEIQAERLISSLTCDLKDKTILSL